MRIKVRLPKVEPGQYDKPAECPYEGCMGARSGSYNMTELYV